MEIEIRKTESREKKKSIPVARRSQDKNSGTGEKAVTAVQDSGSTVYRRPLYEPGFFFPSQLSRFTFVIFVCFSRDLNVSFLTPNWQMY